MNRKLSPATVNLRLSPIRKLGQEMADNGLIDEALARGNERVPGVKQAGQGRELACPRAGAQSANARREARSCHSGLLVGCGLRRAEILSLEVDQIQQREGRWVIPDLVGKGNRRRTVPVSVAVNVRIEEWVLAGDIYKGKLFRPVTKRGKAGSRRALGKLSAHDLRRTCAMLCRKAGGDLEQLKMLLGTEQNLTRAASCG
jgi:integrase